MPASPWLDLAALAAEAPWTAARLMECPGKVQGSAMRGWARHLAARFGATAPRLIRDDLGLSAAALPDDPEGWLPAGLQAAVTEAIVRRYYDGDLLALEPDLLTDAKAPVGRISRTVLRGLGPKRLLGYAPQLHARIWDHGSASVEVGETSGAIHVVGSPLFSTRTWLALQLIALRGAAELAGATPTLRRARRHEGEPGDTDPPSAVRLEIPVTLEIQWEARP